MNYYFISTDCKAFILNKYCRDVDSSMLYWIKNDKLQLKNFLYSQYKLHFIDTCYILILKKIFKSKKIVT